MQSVLKAFNESGQTWEDPSEDLLFMLLEDIERGDEKFLIVERLADATQQTYIQSARNDDGTYVVEYRDGSPQEHFGTNVDDMRSAHALIAAWAIELPKWSESAIWSRIRFES
ncbi:hypothetical protein [Arthrobacter sp. S39]|uniref:hypothetical protein n=1 Tax=Arthrobacter sp. S39 TaxID=2509720 RepID=UPI001A94B4C9|nr:hypothetical protein [Arthrobacter sp. S39]